MEKIWDQVVVGSGPGGAVTALTLAEAGREVLILEEGSPFPIDEKNAFGLYDLVEKYRSSGITLALGQPKVTFVEGALVGGGSEINAGLYHRTPDNILTEWATDFGLKNASGAEMAPHFEWVEKLLQITANDSPPEASKRFEAAANALRWKVVCAPRWLRGGERQSMSRTALPQAVQKGATFRSQVRVQKLKRDGSNWKIVLRGGEVVRARRVYLCAGAIQTPALLLRSKIWGKHRNVGRGLQMHPSFKFVTKFADEVNSKTMGIPSHQVKEFSPHISMGCSISTPAHLGAGLVDYPRELAQVDETWKRMAIYYVMLKPEARGRVWQVPFFGSTQAFFQMTKRDVEALADGAQKLGRLLFQAGATELYPSLEHGVPITKEVGLRSLTASVLSKQSRLMTIHLFSSCPMGEVEELTVTDSYGRFRGEENLFVNDASLLCSAPGVNPQGSLMAFARRNVVEHLSQ